MIRGKGATKEGKFKGLPQPGEDEPLHALITANSPEAVKVAVDKVRNVFSSPFCTSFVVVSACVLFFSLQFLVYFFPLT